MCIRIFRKHRSQHPRSRSSPRFHLMRVPESQPVRHDQRFNSIDRNRGPNRSRRVRTAHKIAHQVMRTAACAALRPASSTAELTCPGDARNRFRRKDSAAQHKDSSVGAMLSSRTKDPRGASLRMTGWAG
jgi:hypothetical protein